MATQKQIDANRRNAQMSTGPLTPEGKEISKMNALKSGLHAESSLVPGESPDQFAELQAQYIERYAPDTPDQRFYVDQLIRNEWLLRRFHRVEEQLWALNAAKVPQGTGLELAQAFTQGDQTFMRLQRRIAHAEKAYKDAIKELTRLQQPAQPQQTKTETPQLASIRPDGLPNPKSRNFLRDMEIYIAESRQKLSEKHPEFEITDEDLAEDPEADAD